MHWALLYTVGGLFVATFILFETGGSFSNEGRHILFTVLCGVMSFVIMVRPLHICVELECAVSARAQDSLGRLLLVYPPNSALLLFSCEVLSMY